MLLLFIFDYAVAEKISILLRRMKFIYQINFKSSKEEFEILMTDNALNCLFNFQ